MTDPRLVAALADRYRLGRALGRGGMATVYLAEDLKHHRPVAVKVLLPELSAAVGADRFLREIEIASRLDHPHILPVYDSGSADGLLYYVMPFVDGESLRDRLNRERQLPLDDVLTITRQVTDALEYAHQRGVVHRDIKPENILLAGGHARVADFGIARLTAPGPDNRLTATGQAIGTPSYMSPEQALGGGTLDGRSDLYSLACVVHELLGGTPPFSGATAQAVVQQHLHAPPPPITATRSTIPAAVEGVLLRALAKVPADRFRSIAAFAEALQAGAAAPTTGPGAGRRLGAWRAAALVLVLLLAGVVWWTGRTPRAVFDVALASGRAQLILADFENHAPDSSLGATVTELLRISLAQSPLVTLLDPAQVGRLLELMRREPGSGLPESVALEAAERGGVTAVISGEVRQVGNRVTILAQLRDPAGAQLAAEQEVADGPEGLVGAVDQLSGRLRGAFGESMRSRRQERPLDQVTTGSLRALRLFSLGMQATNQGDDVRAVELLEEAVAQDSGFAMAYRKLAMILFNRGEFRTRAVDAATRAYRHRDRLTERERHTVTAAFHTIVSGDHDATIRAYRTLLDLHPDDYLALNNIGVVYSQLRDFPRATEYYRRALVVDSTVRLHYSNLAGVLNQQRLFDSADVILDRFEARFPNNPEVLIARIIHAASARDYDRARQLGDSLMVSQRGSVFWEATAYEWLASLAAMRGQLELARRQWTRALALTAERQLAGPYLMRAARRATAEVLLTGEPAVGQRVLDEALTRFPLAGVTPMDRPYWHLAMAEAVSQRQGRARELLADYAAHPDADRGIEARLWTAGATGVLALTEGRDEEAMRAFAEFDSRLACGTCATAWIARGHDRAGRADSAYAALTTLTETPSSQLWFDAGHLPHALVRRAELAEARGDREAAAESYSRFLDLWRDADPQFQPRVRAAREALARLVAEPRASTSGTTPP